jgi:hypothetical protein
LRIPILSPTSAAAFQIAHPERIGLKMISGNYSRG